MRNSVAQLDGTEAHSAPGPIGTAQHAPRSTFHAPGSTLQAPRSRRSAFTLIELLLVMVVIVMVFAIAMPTVANFFRGRTLDSEARRLLSLTRSGQSRAVSEGVPMRLWVDAQQGSYGLQEEPGWTDRDAKAVDFKLDPDLRIEVVASKTAKPVGVGMAAAPPPLAKATGLPELRFLPDGSFDDTGPQVLRLSDRNGFSLWVAPSRSRMNYEIRTRND